MNRVDVRPEMLRWARERAGYSTDALARRFPRLREWERGEAQPTLKQVERYAKATHAPVGFLFLSEPPVEEVPIPDFRTLRSVEIGHPSPDLLDTIYLCQQRQDWYRDFVSSEGDEPLPFVGSARLDDDVVVTAARMRAALRFELDARRRMPTWTDALRQFVAQADDLGVLVMVSGVVGSNNQRKLEPQEFRGFALADELAPLVFINGADTKAAQMFTLAHELSHIWLGQTALSDAEAAATPAQAVEGWCNRVAAELLVPLDVFRAEYDRHAALRTELDRLARRFKVSTLVILRRMSDAGGLRADAYRAAYQDEIEHLRRVAAASGGDFYLTLGARVSKRFARALVVSTLEGRTLFRDAFSMLGIKRDATFRKLSEQLGYGA
jgi:Zn-dependent peptidase ImmA (M78 family)/transcriptional regulator with XRE-family HTH domain